MKRRRSILSNFFVSIALGVTSLALAGVFARGFISEAQNTNTIIQVTQQSGTQASASQATSQPDHQRTAPFEYNFQSYSRSNGERVFVIEIGRLGNQGASTTSNLNMLNITTTDLSTGPYFFSTRFSFVVIGTPVHALIAMFQIKAPFFGTKP